MGGSTKDALDNVQKQKYAMDDNARNYKRDKIDEQTRAGQHTAGQNTGHLMGEFEAGVAEVGDFAERNTRSLMPQGDGDGAQGSDSAEANYSSSGQTQTSSGTGKKAELSDTDSQAPKGASANLTIRKKKPQGETA